MCVPNLTQLAPEIPVTNLPEAIQYYEQKLGFELVSEMPGYAVVERDDVAIHLFEDNRRAHSPVGMHVFTRELDELQNELQTRGAQFTQLIMRKPWGNRDFRVQDRSGNEIKFTELVG